MIEIPRETECSDVCDAVVYPLKGLGFMDLFKEDGWTLDHEKVVNILNDEVKLSKRRVELNREELTSLLGKMLTRIVVLCNHLKGGGEPNAEYVTEKMNSYPVLDPMNQAVLDRILELLRSRYGVELQQHSWG